MTKTILKKLQKLPEGSLLQQLRERYDVERSVTTNHPDYVNPDGFVNEAFYISRIIKLLEEQDEKIKALEKKLST